MPPPPAVVAPGLLLALLAACAMPIRSAGPPRTVPEASGFRRTSSHAEVLAFLEVLEAAGEPRWHRSSFGTTPEGRELPLVVLADPPVRSAEEARASGRPRILVQANIHAGEVEGKEACLRLLREAVLGEAPWPLEKIVFLCVPIYNADGNDALGPKNRPLQNGPPRTGTRRTAQGYDLNRDFVKLDAPESRALTALYRDWDPHLVVDLHTTNGSAHGYELTYAPPLHPGTDPGILRLLEEDWLPELRRRMRARHGFETFDYGNFMTEEGEFQDEVDAIRGWRSFDHRPRFGTNCIGLRNRAAILSEAYAYADFRTRIEATRAFVLEILRLAAEEGEALQEACRRADEATVEGVRSGRLRMPVEVELEARGEAEEVLVRGFREETDPETGETVRVADGPRERVTVPCSVRFRSVRERVVPRAVWVPPAEARLHGLLEEHGIRFDRPPAPEEVEAEVWTARELRRADRPFEGHRARRVAWGAPERRRLRPEPGSLRVPLDQPLGRLAWVLLDPESDDGALVWDLLASPPEAPGDPFPLFLEP